MSLGVIAAAIAIGLSALAQVLVTVLSYHVQSKVLLVNQN